MFVFSLREFHPVRSKQSCCVVALVGDSLICSACGFCSDDQLVNWTKFRAILQNMQGATYPGADLMRLSSFKG